MAAARWRRRRWLRWRWRRTRPLLNPACVQIALGEARASGLSVKIPARSDCPMWHPNRLSVLKAGARLLSLLAACPKNTMCAMKAQDWRTKPTSGLRVAVCRSASFGAVVDWEKQGLDLSKAEQDAR